MITNPKDDHEVLKNRATDKKYKSVSVVLNFIFWGLGHYYAGDHIMALILMAIDTVLFLFIQNVLVTYWYVFLICTALVCYDGYKKISAYNQGLIPSTELITSYRYRSVIIVGIILLLSNFFFEDTLHAIVLVSAGTILIIAGYRMRRRLKKTETALTKQNGMPSV